MRLSEKLPYCIPIFLTLIVSSAIALHYKAPIGADVQFHLKIAEVWARGENGMMSTLPMTVNKLPYPPLIHWILVPAVWLGAELAYAAFVQALLLPSALAASMFIMWKKIGAEAALIGGFLMMGSFAFTDRAGQVNPQALDFILLPLAMLFCIDGRNLDRANLGFIVTSSLMIWNHGVVGAAALGGLFVWKIWKKDFKPILASLIMSLPIIAVTLSYLPSALISMSGGFENLQEKFFWQNPVLFVLDYQRLIAVGFPLALLRIVRRKNDELTQVSLLSLGAMGVMILPWADRFFQYSTIPLSFIVVPSIIRNNLKIKLIAIYAITIAFCILYATMWVWLMWNQYDVRT
jgi:hypothetical protein